MERVTGMDQVKGRYIVVLLAFPFFVLPEFGIGESDRLPWYWLDVVYIYSAQLIDVAFLFLVGLLLRVDYRALFGALPSRREWRLLLHVDLLLFALASALVFAIYLPLSYVTPGYVEWWLEWMTAPVVYLADDDSLPWVANLLNWCSLVLLAPLTEEILFRGFLLRRWSEKWGVTGGIALSSALFGILHPDPVGAALFGVGMCLLYLHTRSLWVPVLAHAIYNFVLWLWDLYGVLDAGFDYYGYYDLTQFRSEWWFGVAAAAIAILSAALFPRQRSDPNRVPEAS